MPESTRPEAPRSGAVPAASVGTVPGYLFLDSQTKASRYSEAVQVFELKLSIQVHLGLESVVCWEGEMVARGGGKEG